MFNLARNKLKIALLALLLLALGQGASATRNQAPAHSYELGGKSAMVQMGASLAPRGAGASSGAPSTGTSGASTLNSPSEVIVRSSSYHDTSIPLRAMNPRPETAPRKTMDVENEIMPTNPRFSGVDPVVQSTFGPLVMPAPLNSWTGYTQQDNYDLYLGLGVLPPDTNGDVGPNHYV